MIKNAIKDEQSITSNWQKVNTPFIEGVEKKEVSNIIKNNGMLTELFRSEWFQSNNEVTQIFKVILQPGALSAWHVHKNTLDRISILYGVINLVLFDGRENSKTAGMINQFILSEHRPATVIIPAGVWHGIHNIDSRNSAILNMVDIAYVYEDPDHWRIAPDDPQIPYTFK